MDWANSINRRRPSVVELRDIYEKADFDFTASRLSGIPLVNPYQEGTNGYFFWEERIKDLKILSPSTNNEKC